MFCTVTRKCKTLFTFLWSPNVIGQTIIFCPVVSIFLLYSFPRLISAVGDWMSTLLPYMVWPKCEFRMHVSNVLNATRWKYRTQKNRQFGTIAQVCRAMSSQLRHVSTIEKKLVRQQYLPQAFLQYGELRPTRG